MPARMSIIGMSCGRTILPISGGETIASVLQAGGLSAKARRTVVDHEIALRNSYWRVSQSRKLSQRLQSWAFRTRFNSAA